MSIKSKAKSLAVGYLATEAANYLAKEFENAGGVPALIGKAAELKDYSVERGSRIASAVREGDQEVLSDEVQEVATDGANAVVGAAKFVQRGGEEIYTKHANMVKTAHRKVKNYMNSTRS